LKFKYEDVEGHCKMFIRKLECYAAITRTLQHLLSINIFSLHVGRVKYDFIMSLLIIITNLWISR